MNTIMDKTIDIDVTMPPLPCNHEDAKRHAKSLAPHSNIARCYLDLVAKIENTNHDNMAG